MKEEQASHYLVYTCTKEGADRHYPLRGYTYTTNKIDSGIVGQYSILEEQELRRTLSKICGTCNPKEIHLIKIITQEEYQEYYKPRTLP